MTESRLNCIKEGEIAEMQTQIKTLFKKDEEKRLTPTVLSEIKSELKVMNLSQQHIRDDLDEVKSNLEQYKNKPADRWDTLVKTVITAVVGGLVGYFLFKMGLGG